MFQHSKSFERVIGRAGERGTASTRPRAEATGEAPATSIGGLRNGEALRAVEWNELTARLNAARDLREEMRQDALLCAGSSGASFGDAAARYFEGLGRVEPPVNPDALEGQKGLGAKVSPTEDEVAGGDAREEHD